MKQRFSRKTVITGIGILAVVLALPQFIGSGTSTMWGTGADVSSAGLGSIASNVSSSRFGFGSGASLGRSAKASPANVAETAPAAPARRYLAMSHHLQVQAPYGTLDKTFEGAVRLCEQHKCDLQAADISRSANAEGRGSARLSARLPPASVDAFLAGVAGPGKVLQHTRESQDKTDQVIDLEARLENLTGLRDRLRALLQDKSRSNLGEIIQVERELANTQAQIDSMVGQRKALAQQTDLVAVHVGFTEEPTILSAGQDGTRALKDALRGIVDNFLESLATLISVVASLLPWALAISLAVAIFARFLPREDDHPGGEASSADSGGQGRAEAGQPASGNVTDKP